MVNQRLEPRYATRADTVEFAVALLKDEQSGAVSIVNSRHSRADLLQSLQNTGGIQLMSSGFHEKSRRICFDGLQSKYGKVTATAHVLIGIDDVGFRKVEPPGAKLWGKP